MKYQVLMLAFGKPDEVREVTVPNDEFTSIDEVLNLIFHYGQNDFQSLPHPSVSCGDVAVVDNKFYFCAPVGWKEITAEQLEEYKKLDRRDRLFSALREI